MTVNNFLQYQLPHKDVKLSDLFVVLERAKKSLHVEDYSINQTTLDEVSFTVEAV